MKCVCGYVKEADWQSEDGKNHGDEEFIRIEHSVMEIDNDCFDGWHYNRTVKIQLYGCPKCGTIRFEEKY